MSLEHPINYLQCVHGLASSFFGAKIHECTIFFRQTADTSHMAVPAIERRRWWRQGGWVTTMLSPLFRLW